MTGRQILIAWLKEHGYDGLYGYGSCACLIDDLCPCDSEGVLNCEPGYKVPCPRNGGCECDEDDPDAWHVQAEKGT